MTFVYPDIDCVFDTGGEMISTLIIENQPLLRTLLTDLRQQISGLDGRSVLSEGDKILPPGKHLELLDRFVPFDLNTRSLLTKIVSELEKRAVSEEYYAETITFLGDTERFLTDLSFDFPVDLTFSKISAGSLIKAAGVEICDDYDSLGEKIIDYFQMVRDLVGSKLFITVNLRSYLTDEETGFFMKTVASHQFDVIMIESTEHVRLPAECRRVVDADLCLIG